MGPPAFKLLLYKGALVRREEAVVLHACWRGVPQSSLPQPLETMGKLGEEKDHEVQQSRHTAGIAKYLSILTISCLSFAAVIATALGYCHTPRVVPDCASSAASDALLMRCEAQAGESSG